MLDQDEAVAADAVAPEAPPSPRPTRLGFAATVVGVFLAVGLLLAGTVRMLVDGSRADGATEYEPTITDLESNHPCPDAGDDDVELDAVRSLGQLVDCLERRPTSDWPIGVFDVDGRAYLVQPVDGTVSLRAVRDCRRDAGSLTETTTVESLGWEFRARGGWVEFALPGYGGGEVTEFRETDGDTFTAGASFGGGREPGPEVEIPDAWQRDGTTMAVFELYFCGVPMEEAVRLIEPLARG